MPQVNRQTGANVDPNADPGDMLQSNTRGLMAAMSTLPELTERKRTIDKHTALLGSIVKVSHDGQHPAWRERDITYTGGGSKGALRLGHCKMSCMHRQPYSSMAASNSRL